MATTLADITEAFTSRVIKDRTLAFLSFACLLGHFYGLRTMRLFGCWVLPPATTLLVLVAYRNRRHARELSSPYTWIVHGVIGGVVAVVAYDLYRLPSFTFSAGPTIFPTAQHSGSCSWPW